MVVGARNNTVSSTAKLLEGKGEGVLLGQESMTIREINDSES